MRERYIATTLSCQTDIYSHRHPGHAQLDELRQCRLCWLLFHRNPVVRHLRKEALQGPDSIIGPSEGRSIRRRCDSKPDCRCTHAQCQGVVGAPTPEHPS